MSPYIFATMDELYHIYSNGADSTDLFVCESDMDAAMNRIAVSAVISGISVMGFCIQDTHIHLLVKGIMDKVCHFAKEYQRRTRDYISRFTDNVINDFRLDVLPVTDLDYAKQVGAYVICQATKDGKNVLPQDYRWSSASLYFRQVRNDLLWINDVSGLPGKIYSMGELSKNYQRKTFHVSNRLPDNLCVCNGIILPSSFVHYNEFEQLYKTHNAFRVFCGSSSAKDREIMQKMSEFSGISLDEREARQIASKVCLEEFKICDIRKLDTEQRMSVARILRLRYKIGLSQIARPVFLPEKEIRKYIK